MSWISISSSVHHCHDSDDGATSLVLPEVEEEEAAGMVAMAIAAAIPEREEEQAEDARRGRSRKLWKLGESARRRKDPECLRTGWPLWGESTV